MALRKKRGKKASAAKSYAKAAPRKRRMKAPKVRGKASKTAKFSRPTKKPKKK